MTVAISGPTAAAISGPTTAAMPGSPAVAIPDLPERRDTIPTSQHRILQGTTSEEPDVHD